MSTGSVTSAAMTDPLVLSDLTEDEVARLAQDLAFMLAPGQALALSGDLGAGKTTFARAFIRAAANDQALEAPSPTFTLSQTYETPRFTIAHLDLYRLESPEELDELGVDAALADGVALIEWPERAAGRLPDSLWMLRLDEADDDTRRRATLRASKSIATRIERYREIRAFLAAAGWGGSSDRLNYLQGDASPRRYARLDGGDGRKAILMDAPASGDGPPIRDGKPYSRIAHLAEDVRAFVAVANALRARGLAAPEIFAHDFDHGLLLIEDFGDKVFGAEARHGGDQAGYWARGVDALVALRTSPPSEVLALPDGARYRLPRLDAGVLEIETALLVDWYWPATFGAPAPLHARESFAAAWGDVFDAILAEPPGWMLRDYHSPNLIALDDRPPPQDVGMIDFQDALIGPLAYDLVSLLQDARVDVSADLELALLNRYVDKVRAGDAAFDGAQFRFSYAALGAQRNTKILGIFARLAVRDGKRGYLAHIPRIWGYLERDLAHPRLAPLAAWYDAHLPIAGRRRALAI
ncbi:MAG: tRNA (adenosine(37)-N6)-threonylcarbamoyltransferase complex ATPase subunit type 1 TsaE [Hyphomicrobium sp.]